LNNVSPGGAHFGDGVAVICIYRVFTPSAAFLAEPLTKKHENWRTANKFAAFHGEPITKTLENLRTVNKFVNTSPRF
jgi:hypothetical protein